MSIKKMYLKNRILVYIGDNYDFYITGGFGCVCDNCNRKMATTYYYPVLNRGVCPLCHEEIKARHEDKLLHIDDVKFQIMKSLLFEQQIKQAGFDIEEEESNDSKN